MLSFQSFLAEVSNAEATVINLLRLADKPGTPQEGAVALAQAKKLAAKHGLNIDDLRAKMNAQPPRSASSGGYDPRKSEGVDAVFAMWEATIRDADDHHHGFQFTKMAGSGSDIYRIYKSSKYPDYELRIFLYHFELWKKDQEIASGTGHGRVGAFRMVLISMDYIKRITEWAEQIRTIAEKAGYVVFKEPAGHNGYETWLHHKKNNRFIVRIYGYNTDKNDRSRGSAVAFDEKSSVPIFAKATEDNPKSIKTFTAALKANKPVK
jgi:hypothetical protein